jgi:hypothetical protein
MDDVHAHLPANHPATGHLLPCRAARSVCRHRARCVGDDVGRPRAALRAAPGQAMPRRRWAMQVARTVCVGRPCGFWPVDSFLNRNSFLFISNLFNIQILKIHI